MSFLVLQPSWVAHSDGFTVGFRAPDRIVYSDVTVRAVYAVDPSLPAWELGADAATVTVDEGQPAPPAEAIATRAALGICALGPVALPEPGLRDGSVAFPLLLDLESPSPAEFVDLVEILEAGAGEWRGRVIWLNLADGEVTLGRVDGDGSARWSLSLDDATKALPQMTLAVLGELDGLTGATIEEVEDAGAEPAPPVLRLDDGSGHLIVAELGAEPATVEVRGQRLRLRVEAEASAVLLLAVYGSAGHDSGDDWLPESVELELQDVIVVPPEDLETLDELHDWCIAVLEGPEPEVP